MKGFKAGRLAGMVVLIGALAACSSPPAVQKAPAARPAAPVRDVLAEVRAAGVEITEEGLDVTPLRDPAVADLREAASRQEAAGELAKADAALVQALELAPGDPDLLQWRAELALARGQYDEAVRLASESWEKGPRLGGLCRRNWTAVRIARELTGFPEAAQAASEQVARCTVAPPVRM